MGLMPPHLRADDGIRTRDPHLGKVMRYQLRYIRVPRARSSPVAKGNNSRPVRGDTNPLFTSGYRLSVLDSVVSVVVVVDVREAESVVPHADSARAARISMTGPTRTVVAVTIPAGPEPGRSL